MDDAQIDVSFSNALVVADLSVDERIVRRVPVLVPAPRSLGRMAGGGEVPDLHVSAVAPIA